MLKFKSYMEIALTEAKIAARREEVPVGAVIVNKYGDTIAKSGNRIRELKDPTAHAEILTIREACMKQQSERLIGHDIYVTLQPCKMCLQAIIHARIARLYYGAPDTSNAHLDINYIENGNHSLHPSLEIYPNIHEHESSKLIRQFFNERR